MKDMNRIIDNQEVFPENYIERHWRDADKRLYRIDNWIIMSDIRKKEILLLIEEFLDIIESYTEFCKDVSISLEWADPTLIDSEHGEIPDISANEPVKVLIKLSTSKGCSSQIR